jgi:hypothetical protein
MSVPLLVLKVHIFRIISLSIARKQKKYDELQTSVKQDDTTRTRTPKPGYLNLSNVHNGKALTRTMMLFLQLFLGPLPPRNRTFRHPILATMDLRDLLIKKIACVITNLKQYLFIVK